MRKSLTGLLHGATRNLFFTGKGGVGKTSLACAVALWLADNGRRVLIVSTDPASNLDEVFGVPLGGTPTLIPGTLRLYGLNLDPQAAALSYREKLVGPYRDKLPSSVIRSMEEQLSGACTVEIAAFDEFSKLLAAPDQTAGFDHIVFDTAPTGHTLRLLSLPKAWSSYLDTNSSGTSCLGPLSGLNEQRALYESSVKSLTDAGTTTFVLVTRPQRSALREARKTSAELLALGVQRQLLVVNGVFHLDEREDTISAALAHRGACALTDANSFVRSLPSCEVPLRGNNVLGLQSLRDLLREKEVPAQGASFQACARPPEMGSLRDLVEELSSGPGGLIMTMGKGGVGKTTIASAIAVSLARKGLPVHLSTTDPAAHIQWIAEDVPGLEMSRIDPEEETRKHSEQVLRTAGASLDEQGRLLLEEDLRSPCTEEIAVFRAFARIVAEGEKGFVVLDTAPTGHTLLLLDATEAYHREVAKKISDMPREVRELLPRLRNRSFTRVIIVTLPEATPVHEAERLQRDLRRAEIEPFAWVVNQSFAATPSHHPLIQNRAQNEAHYLDEVKRLSSRAVLVPWVTAEPIGEAALNDLVALRTGTAQPEEALP